MIYRQDEHVKQNFRKDWPQVRSRLLQKSLDEGIPGPTNGSVTDNPSWRRPQEYRDKANVSDKQIVNPGDEVSIKEHKERPIMFGFVKG